MTGFALNSNSDETPQNRMFTRYKDNIPGMLSRLDQKTFSASAYDTAWVARVTEPSNRQCLSYPMALDWLRQHQHPDGSWGGAIEYFHDRIISTLNALVTLSSIGDQAGDRLAISNGERYIWQHFDHLINDPQDTVGFELILPVLFDQASELGLDLPYEKCRPYRRIRSEKLGLIPEDLLYSRKVSSTHSLEFLGNSLKTDALANLQEANGSYGNSPGASAYVLTICPNNMPARKYVEEVISMDSGSAIAAHPVDIFNKSWVLYHLDLTGNLIDSIDLARHHLEDLWQSWDCEWGVGFARHYPVVDLDDTAIVYKLLRRYGYRANPDVFLQYEKDTHFSCYTFERTPSVGANVHLLDALGSSPGFEHRGRMLRKLIRFLRTSRVDNAFWSDKWHISPYYITSHAVTALIGFDNDLARGAVQWILSTQRPDGAWGYYCPTSEETAYCLQALITYHNLVERLDITRLYRGADYLCQHANDRHYPEMWIEKSLYTPIHIVEAAILSALIMVENL
jgi:halimadienyl-diphosphate synthase